MSPQKQLSNFIDSLLLTYMFSNNSEVVEPSIIEDYKKLNERCDDVISRIKLRKNK